MKAYPHEQPGCEPGTYLLDIQLRRPIILSPGRLGTFEFEAGQYLYIGSARGAGGVRARLRRHQALAKTNVRHWHVDDLLAAGDLRGSWWTNANGANECAWAELLGGYGAREPVGFGSSDCRCAGHLVFMSSGHALEAAVHQLRNQTDGDLHYSVLQT
ncbi:MAG: GIY-YIG nuclease family protein [Anaerolineales bacterium]